MDRLEEKIKQLFDETNELLKSDQFQEAKKNIEIILILDSSNEEAISILKKIDENEKIKQLFSETKQLLKLDKYQEAKKNWN